MPSVVCCLCCHLHNLWLQCCEYCLGWSLGLVRQTDGRRRHSHIGPRTGTATPPQAGFLPFHNYDYVSSIGKYLSLLGRVLLLCYLNHLIQQNYYDVILFNLVETKHHYITCVFDVCSYELHPLIIKI